MNEALKVAFALVGPIAIVLFAYNVAEFVTEHEYFIKKKEKKWYTDNKKELLARLEQLQNIENNESEKLEESEILDVLDVLILYSTFTEGQNQITHFGNIKKVVDLLEYPADDDKRIQEKTLMVINNLVANEANHNLLIKRCIPSLIRILENSNIRLSTSVELFSSVLTPLTVLTKVNESHTYIIRRIQVFQHILHECEDVNIKLQIFNILVNVSANKKICENMYEFDAQLLRCMEPFIMLSKNDTFVLKAVSCCANILESLQRRWKYGNEPNIATPEFISERFQGKLLKLSLHDDENIQFQARRCVSGLRAPLSPMSSYNSLEQIDVAEVLNV